MKKTTTDNSSENSEVINKGPQTSAKKLSEGGLNSNQPQEYEEQVSPNIRMKPQPFIKPKKVRLKDDKN